MAPEDAESRSRAGSDTESEILGQLAAPKRKPDDGADFI
jgi:hypothetical protein